MDIVTRLREKKKKLLEEHFFRPKWYSVFLNPYFINRWSLYRSIATFAKGVSKKDRVLDVGCGLKPYRDLFKVDEYIGIDIEGGGHDDGAKVVDAYYDGHNIPYDDDSFDIVVCTQVLEHAESPDGVVKEIARVLRPEGRVFISMPFTYPEHEVPYDFQRFTRFQHQALLEKHGFGDIEITQTTGFLGTFTQLFVVWVFESITFRASLLKLLLSVFVFGPIQILGLLFDRLLGRSGQTMDYTVVAKRV